MKNLIAIPQHASKTFEGIDVDLATCIHERTVVATQDMKDCTLEDEYFCLYEVDPIPTLDNNRRRFDWGYITATDLDNLVKGNDWMNPEDCNSFLETTGTSLEDWLNLEFIQKVNDLHRYWGHENIFGLCYWFGWNINKVCEFMNIDPEEFIDG